MCTLVISLLCAPAFAAGFGISAAQAQPSDNQAIDKLLEQAKQKQAKQNSSQSVKPPLAESHNSNGNSNGNSNSNGYVLNGGGVSSDEISFGNTSISRAAFANTVRNLMPLSPAQIKTLRLLFDRSQRAVATYPGIPPRPTATSILVNLSPGATPPIIRLRAGFVTSLVFVDSTGQSWPIQAYDLGDPKAFNIQWDQKGNTLLVQALDQYKPGNLAVILRGLDTPVMLTLLPGQKAVDYRVDLRVPGLGPNAKPLVIGIPGTGTPELIDFLNGIPPEGSITLSVEGGQAEAWLYRDHMYIRTRMTILSPSWLATMSSPDGTHVYELNTAPVVLASQRGAMVQLMIKGL